MTHLERLKNSNKYDKLLVAYIIANGVVDLVNNNPRFNRGDFCEMCKTHTTVNNSGLHGISHGDFIASNNNAYEIKYCTCKTAPSAPLVGTTCEYTLVDFNNGATIETRLIKSNELVVDCYNHITFKNNYQKGTLIKVFKGALKNGK
jgi:hypothetical protein